MSKTQVLAEAKCGNIGRIAANRKDEITTAFVSKGLAIHDALGRMTSGERSTFAEQVMAALKRERRRAAARAVSYDMDRHITLYLTAKALSKDTK